jgi:hypothetical protein
MTQQLQSVIDAARDLSAREKLELMQVIASDIMQVDSSLVEGDTQFRACRSIAELVSSQSTPVVTDLQSLAADFWPADESADEINQFVAERRLADRMGRP